MRPTDSRLPCRSSLSRNRKTSYHDPLVICGVTTMRFRVRKSAHVLERLGLAMAGAASGLFVGVLVGSNVDALTSQGFLLMMMFGGAVGFYLGIDTPPLPFHPANGGPDDQIDTADFLSA